MTNDSTNYYVYGHYDKSDNSLFYIGKGTSSRAYSKKNRNKYWHNIVNKHGFEVKILKDQLSEKEALSLEVDLISQLNPKANFTKGGDGGNTYVKKTRAEIEEIMRKRMLKVDRQKLATFGFRGKKHSEERNKKLSERHKGKTFRPLTNEDFERLRKVGKAKSIKIMNSETKEIYESIRDCSRKTGLSKSWIIWNIKRNKRFIKI